MASIIAWLAGNWSNILAVVGGLVALATAITALTPSPKDDAWVAKVRQFLSRFSFLGHIDGTPPVSRASDPEALVTRPADRGGSDNIRML